MRLSALLTAMTGLAVAGGSAWFALDVLQTQRAGLAEELRRQQEEANESTVEVIVAAVDIPFGEEIDRSQLATIRWPREAIPQGIFTDFSTLVPEADDPHRRAKRAMAQGELVLASKVSGFGEKVTLTQTLTPGHRAMAIKVSAETAAGGFVTPGDAVDIVLTHGRDETLRTVTVLQNVRVVGVDQLSDEQSDAPVVARTVTVEVTPENGQKLALAQRAGALSISLRSLDMAEGQEEDAPLESVRLADILQQVSPLPEGEKAPTIRIFRGTDVTEVTN